MQLPRSRGVTELSGCEKAMPPGKHRWRLSPGRGGVGPEGLRLPDLRPD